VTNHVAEKLCVIGLGLVGSSIARAVRERYLAGHITACDTNEVSLAYARKHGFADSTTSSAENAVKDCDLVILATPAAALESVAQAIAPHLKRGAIVMDVCSVKEPAIAAIAPHIPEGVHFIPAHPIAGSEHTGVSAGRADLFERRRVMVTPMDAKLDDALQLVTSFWTRMGARVEAMPPHLHDLIYAYVSHLPHLLAFAAYKPLEQYESYKETDELLARFMRLCGASTELWIDIFLLNRDNILSALDRYLDVILHIRSELQEAPEAPGSESNEKNARTALFPRIAASCLVTTIMEAERKAGFPFARYSGSGFADFSYPASQPPEDDIESISEQYVHVTHALDEYIERLRNFRAVLASGSSEDAASALA
jgi:cyclohexadieny/prephenate dehydrogenase